MLVTLEYYDNPVRANLDKLRLESEGIAAYLFDEHMIGLNPLLSVSLGGIKLKVNAEDLSGARKLLRQPDDAEPVLCPICESADVETNLTEARSAPAVWSMIISLLTFTYPLHRDRFNSCRACGYKFTQKQDE